LGEISPINAAGHQKRPRSLDDEATDLDVTSVPFPAALPDRCDPGRLCGV